MPEWHPHLDRVMVVMVVTVVLYHPSGEGMDALIVTARISASVR